VKLTPLQERYLQELAKTPDDQSGAYARACQGMGRAVPKALKQSASEALLRPHVAAAWNELRTARAQELRLDARAVLQDLVDVFEVDMHQVAPWGPEGVNVIPSSQLTRAQRRAVKRLRVMRTERTFTHKDGSKEHRVEINHQFELYSLTDIAKLLGSHLGLWDPDEEDRGGVYRELVAKLRQKLAELTTDDLRKVYDRLRAARATQPARIDGPGT
jgi:hypothetical protein